MALRTRIFINKKGAVYFIKGIFEPKPKCLLYIEIVNFTRAAEHMGVSNLTGKRLKNVKDTAVSSHLFQRNCTIDFDHFDILATDISKFNLLVKESLLIKRSNSALSRTTKSFSLELFD